MPRCFNFSSTVLLFLAAAVSAQPFDDLATPEFRVNGFEIGDQRIPIVASDGSGRWLVIWQSRNQELPGWAIYGQRFGPVAETLGEEFRVNVFNIASQDGQALAMAEDGSFAVAWNGPDRTSAGPVISLRRFDADGRALAGDRRISDDPGRTQLLPRLDHLPNGQLILVWEADLGAEGFDLFSRRALGVGEPAGPISTVNQIRAEAQRRADLVATEAGGSIVVWQDVLADGDDWGIRLRCLDASGQGPSEQTVNQTTARLQYQPRVALRPDGQFAVVWQDTAGQSSLVYRRVMVRRYGPDCQPLGDEQQVNQFDQGIQDLPAIAVDGLGHYVLVWQSFPEDFTLQGIYGRRLAADGEFLGDEFLVRQEVAAFQDFPDVAGLPDGGFVATWESAGQDESGFGIYARQFRGPGPDLISVLQGDNQEAVVGEPFALPLVVEVRDQWQQPLADALLRLDASASQAAPIFANGLSEIEGRTDSEGRIEFALSANSVSGAYALAITAPATGRLRTVSLRNLPAAGPPSPDPSTALRPVPVDRVWALIVLFALLVVLARRALIS